MTEKICTHGHNHHQHCVDFEQNASKTLIVIIITLVTMFFEIGFGYFTRSMALLSDGWHMGTHAFALAITFSAYLIINKFRDTDLFPHGTEKITALAGFVSSLFLGLTGIFIIFESVMRFINPLSIVFNTAILVAVIGLVVNGICLIVMECGCGAKDYNFKAAYLHILADALTSVLAIVALICGKLFCLYFLDPLMGCAGGILIIRWSVGLIKDTTLELLDIHK